MDKKISKSDKGGIIELLLDRSMPFKENIRVFSEKAGFPLSEDGTIDYNEGEEKCLLTYLDLNDQIEIGYFDYQLERSVKVITTECEKRNMIALTFNFGSGLDQSVENQEEVTSEGITNSIFINNARVKTQTSVIKGKRLHMFVIRYQKDFLRKNFGMAPYFINEIVDKEGPMIIYEDLNDGIIQALRTMEIHKIPSLTRIPFLLGKCYELMALFVDVIENRNNTKSAHFNSLEFERLLMAKKYIVEDWKNPPTIHQVSEFLGMSPTKAKVLFKQLFGKPIYTYFQEKRMAEALRLINEEELTIAEIGHQLGYKNLGHFAESFKKQYGILPKKLSKSIKST